MAGEHNCWRRSQSDESAGAGEHKSGAREGGKHKQKSAGAEEYNCNGREDGNLVRGHSRRHWTQRPGEFREFHTSSDLKIVFLNLRNSRRDRFVGSASALALRMNTLAGPRTELGVGALHDTLS